MLHNYSKRLSILILSHSNAAIDELVSRILTHKLINKNGDNFIPEIVRLSNSNNNVTDLLSK